MATGEFIINFDDDDLYAAGYVKKMVSLMVQRRLIGVTLSAWYNYYIGKGMCTFSASRLLIARLGLAISGSGELGRMGRRPRRAR